MLLKESLLGEDERTSVSGTKEQIRKSASIFLVLGVVPETNHNSKLYKWHMKLRKS